MVVVVLDEVELVVVVVVVVEVTVVTVDVEDVLKHELQRTGHDRNNSGP